MATVICHFYNEEYLLPWWLEHHRKIFNHGIMIDYHSTDNSVNLIKQYCPTWDIVTTRNQYFDSAIIDREVEYYEAKCQGWRVALNVTEFLYGNVKQLETIIEPTQIFLGNYVFVDNDYQEPNPNISLDQQKTWGYYEDTNACAKLPLGLRANRSMHNYANKYPVLGGRHYSNSPTFSDLAIFYYGYAILTDKMLQRKMQIKTKMSPEERSKCGTNHPNTLTKNQYLENINKHHRPRCHNLIKDIEKFTSF